MKARLATPATLVDISELPSLAGVTIEDGTVSVGATTTYADALTAEGMASACPGFVEALGLIGDTQVRNRGTVGGNLAHADPASDLPAVALAADATVHATGPDGEREIPADEFFLATYTTALGEGELLTAVELPALATAAGSAYAKKEHPASGYALVGVAARVETDGDRIDTARVAATGALTAAARLTPVEEALDGAAVGAPDLASDAAAHATDDVEEWELLDDAHASAEFRAHLLSVYAERAIETALDRATATGDVGATVERPPTR
jgi:carbon-monoxide dehydrogenase medium subunit